MTWFQVWFWFTITAAAFIGWELWRAPLQDWRDDPTSHNYTTTDSAACLLCGYREGDHYKNGMGKYKDVPKRTWSDYDWAGRIIDAWLRNTVAHQPCEGTGTLPTAKSYNPETGVETILHRSKSCPGPHVEILTLANCCTNPPCGHTTVLFADPDRIHQWADPNEWALTLPLPPGWNHDA